MSLNFTQPDYHILAAIRSEEDFRPLLSLSYLLARSRNGRITVITVRQHSSQRPAWLTVPSTMSDVPIEINTMQSETAGKGILNTMREISPDLLLVGWQGNPPRKGYILGDTLDHVLQRAWCDLLVVKALPTWPDEGFLKEKIMKVLVPTAGGPNSVLAFELGLDVAKNSDVTAFFIASQSADQAELNEREQWLSEFTQPWTAHPNFKTKVLQAEDVVKGIVIESTNYHLTIVGSTNDSAFSQLAFGTFPQQIAVQNKGTTVVVRQFDESIGPTLTRFWWRATHFLPKLSLEERMEVYKQIRRGARPQVDFFMMIGLAAGIAALGLLLNSPAVIIGAMLVAPLMAAIIGMGLAVIQADSRLLALASRATLRGVLLAIGMGFLAGFLLQSVAAPTDEIMGRTRPGPFDLGVAIISGLAGAYALCRRNMSASLPGVAIAVALVPPLATVGIGLAWLNTNIAFGAMLLFLTNLIAIVTASSFVFFVLGFRPKLDRLGWRGVFGGGMATSVVLLILMGWVLWSISSDSLYEAARNRVITSVLVKEVPNMAPGATLDSWRVRDPDELLIPVETEVIDAEAVEHTLALEVQVRSPSHLGYNRTDTLRSSVHEALFLKGMIEAEDRIGLDLLIIRTESLLPEILPTPIITPTQISPLSATSSVTDEPLPTSTATTAPTATNTPLPTPTTTPPPSPTPTFTPSPTSTVIATASPTNTATATQTATPTSIPAVVANTDGQGLRLRWIPGGPIAAALPEGSIVEMLHHHEVDAEGVSWVKVDAQDGRIGWVAAEYLVELR